MTRLRGAWLLLALLGWSGRALGAELLIEAQRLDVAEGVVSGEGHVRVTLGEATAEGERFRYDLEQGTLVLEQGSWARPEGLLRFTRAELALGDGSGVVLQGEYQGADGRLRVEGERLVWLGERRFEGEQVSLTTCACEEPLWEISARAVRVQLDQVAVFRGGWISVCGQRVLPVPAGALPLAERQAGLLPPRLGWGEDGLLASLPIYLPLGEAADLTLEPELRTGRGERLLVEGRYALPEGEGGELRGAAGWDHADQEARGAMQVDHRWSEGPVLTGAEASLWSDQDYISDYGGSFLVRAAPWAEARALAGLGPVWLATDGFQGREALGQRPLSGGLRVAGQPIGPVATELGATVDWIGKGDASWRAEGLSARMSARGAATAGAALGPAELRGEVSAEGVRWMDGDPFANAGLALGARLPMWAPLPRGLLLLDAGVEGALHPAWGTPELRAPEDAPPPAWSAGPTVALRTITASGVPLSAAVALPWTAEGFAPVGALRLREGPVEARAQAGLDLQEGSILFDDGQIRLGLGAARLSRASAVALAQARTELAWTLPGPLASLRPSWRGLLDLQAPSLLSQGPGLAWKPRCDCLRLEAQATWSADRTSPDLGFNAQIW